MLMKRNIPTLTSEWWDGIEGPLKTWSSEKFTYWEDVSPSQMKMLWWPKSGNYHTCSTNSLPLQLIFQTIALWFLKRCSQDIIMDSDFKLVGVTMLASLMWWNLLGKNLSGPLMLYMDIAYKAFKNCNCFKKMV
jgi:hypothetical protein